MFGPAHKINQKNKCLWNNGHLGSTPQMDLKAKWDDKIQMSQAVLTVWQSKLLWVKTTVKPIQRATLEEEETMSDADNKAVSNVTVTRQPLSLSMWTKKQKQTFDSHYREKSDMEMCKRRDKLFIPPGYFGKALRMKLNWQGGEKLESVLIDLLLF